MQGRDKRRWSNKMKRRRRKRGDEKRNDSSRSTRAMMKVEAEVVMMIMVKEPRANEDGEGGRARTV